MAKISFSLLCMLSSIAFETIEISSIIITLSSESDILSCVLFRSDNGRTCRLSPISLGMARPVLKVVASIFTPVGAIIKRVGISGFDGPCPKVFSAV